MDIFKAFGIIKHWPTQQEWDEYQQGRGVESRDDAPVVEQTELDDEQLKEALAYLQSGSELDEGDKPYLTSEQARKAGIFRDRKPDPEPGTEVKDKYEQIRGIYPDRGEKLRSKGDYQLPPLGEYPVDYADPNKKPRRGE